MKLNARLNSIARFIPVGSLVADIGTDHALLPIYLIREGIAERVIASDLNKGPLEAAKINVANAGLSGKIQLRLGNGLEVVASGEVQVCVISGMGGPTIREIIKSGNEKAKIEQFVLQPMGGSSGLRVWLVDHGWQIKDEDLIKEDKRIYEIMYVVRGTEKTSDRTEISIGPRLLENNHPLLSELLLQELQQNRNILTGLGQSSKSEAVLAKIQVIENRNRSLERIIKCL